MIQATEKPVADMVNHPPHYKGVNGIECIDAIEAALTPEEYHGYLRGNALKYLWRCERKHASPLEDIKKAQFYLERYKRALAG